MNIRENLALQAAMQAEKVRKKCGIAQAAPIDIYDVAEKLSCEVRLKSLPSLEGIYCPNPCVIILGSDRPSGRRAFNCAHELGHHIFEHGTRIDALKDEKNNKQKSKEEFIADTFASFLLMPQISIRRALNDRQWSVKNLSSMQVLRLASYFGVGYNTIINHLKWGLKIISFDPLYVKLCKVQPKNIKIQFETDAQFELIMVDEFWQHRPIDIEIGDTLVLPADAMVDDYSKLVPLGKINGELCFRAKSKGYTQARHLQTGWVAYVRIAEKEYEGLPKYRFLED